VFFGFFPEFDLGGMDLFNMGVEKVLKVAVKVILA